MLGSAQEGIVLPINGIIVPIGTPPPCEGNTQFSSTGWTKLPGGLILQWMPSAYRRGIYNFPKPFPNAVFNVYATNTDQQGDKNDNAYAYPISNSTFYVATRGANGNLQSGFPTAILAIGY